MKESLKKEPVEYLLKWDIKKFLLWKFICLEIIKKQNP
jgi:hypothetical protein